MSDNTNSAVDAKKKRAISMKDFRSNDLMRAIQKDETSEGKIGQIVGVAYGVEIKKGTLPDGTPKDSKLIIGDFEAVNEATGQVFTAGGVYLPEFYADEIAVMTSKVEGGITFAVEIWMEKNPRGWNADGILVGIPYQYAIKNMLDREPHDPISMMKAKLAKAGRLGKLPPPAGLALPAPAPAPETAPPAAEDAPAGKGKAKAA